MKRVPVILPGDPFDDNRDYLPLSIKGTDRTLNENGNSSQVYPARLEEHVEPLLDDEPETWYEYVPESYDPTRPTALVFSMHGGMMNGWGQCIYTSWSMVAEREGFICVFPTAHYPGFWQTEQDPNMKFRSLGGISLPPAVDPHEGRDSLIVLKLIEKMKEKYNIDPGRIFMQGMTMGNLMTSTFARYFGKVLAGAGGSGGPCGPALLFDENGNVKNEAGPLAVFQTRPEFNEWPRDRSEEGVTRNRQNRDYWLQVNGCSPIPEISIQGERNFAFYKGAKSDLVFLEIQNRDHGQALDEAELMWDYLFSGVRRMEDGSLRYTASNLPRRGDDFALAVAEGCENAWFGNAVTPMGGKALKWQKLKYHGLNGDAQVRGEYLCVPLRFLCEAFGAEYLPSEDTLSAQVILSDGRTLQFARGSIGCVVDGRITSMLCEALHREGELYVPFRWFCQALFDLHVSEIAGTVYATDHWSVLGNNTAHLLRELLQ